MQRKNIPSHVLAKGISEEGFRQLLDNIKSAVIEEGLNKLNQYDELLESIKNNKDEDYALEWEKTFKKQLEESSEIINTNMTKIEELFNKIFTDWEKYKEEHINDEIKEEVLTEENVEETKEEIPIEENVEETKEVTANEETPVEESGDKDE